MARKVVSLLRRGPGGLRAPDPALEANAYALAVDVDLTVVLMGDAVDLAAVGAESGSRHIGDADLPAPTEAQDLRGLIESGVGILAASADARRRGIRDEHLLAGVRTADGEELDALLADADAVINW